MHGIPQRRPTGSLQSRIFDPSLLGAQGHVFWSLPHFLHKFLLTIGEKVKSTSGAPLFPGNDVIGQTPPTELLINHLRANEKEISLFIVDKPKTDNEIIPFFGKLADAVNLINMRADANERILTHSVAQNNVAETFHSSALKDIELRLASIETSIWGIQRALLAGKEVQQVPPPPSHSTNDKIDLIAHKVSTIEEKVKQVNKVAVNPPGPQNKTQKTEGTQGAGKKGTEEATNLPKPTWYEYILTNAATSQLSFWAAMIATGKWGAPRGDGVEGFNFQTEADRRNIVGYICRALHHHFPKGSNGSFPAPPKEPTPLTSGWTKKISWIILDCMDQHIESFRHTVYAPGRDSKTRSVLSTNTNPPTHVDKGKQRKTELPASTIDALPTENPWTTVPSGGSKPKPSPPKSFAQATSTPKQKITAPQPKYDNVPTTRFMAPMPKRPPPRRTGNFGKRWIIRFHREEKPTKGTATPIQVVVAEINRTSAQFNVKANSAEWTSAMNLLIYFSFDSIKSQITKCSKTILGALAKGCERAIFMKSVKWSRIVVRGVPVQHWIAEAPPNTPESLELPNGRFAPVTKPDMEHALWASHPLLETAIFMEGPDWTDKSGKPPLEASFANISFAIPDPDDECVKALVRRPLLLFNTPCHCTRWTEKIKLIQCQRCWKYGDQVHPDCPPRC